MRLMVGEAKYLTGSACKVGSTEAMSRGSGQRLRLEEWCASPDPAPTGVQGGWLGGQRRG